MNIVKNIYYVGVNDHITTLFEGQFDVPNGMAYNSYVIVDQKIAILDTVDAKFGNEWLENIKSVIGDREPDYLVVHHMEPDHSANIQLIINAFPNIQIVSSALAFDMMNNFYKLSPAKVVIKEGDILDLGEHKLQFISAPMVHWPEVMLSYETQEKVLFSADAFGKFGALDVDEDWDCEARRYYFGIVGKFGANVQLLLNKAKNLDIKTICPLHGPILNNNLEHYINQYNTWSSYTPESEGIVIAYTSVYGNTKKAVEELAKILTNKGCPKVVTTNLILDDNAEAVEDAFRYGKLILATTTYNADIFPKMKEFIDSLTERNYQKRKIGFIENGSWAPTAAKIMQEKFAKSVDITFSNVVVTIKSSLNDNSYTKLEKLAEDMLI